MKVAFIVLLLFVHTCCEAIHYQTDELFTNRTAFDRDLMFKGAIDGIKGVVIGSPLDVYKDSYDGFVVEGDVLYSIFYNKKQKNSDTKEGFQVVGFLKPCDDVGQMCLMYWNEFKLFIPNFIDFTKPQEWVSRGVFFSSTPFRSYSEFGLSFDITTITADCETCAFRRMRFILDNQRGLIKLITQDKRFIRVDNLRGRKGIFVLDKPYGSNTVNQDKHIAYNLLLNINVNNYLKSIDHTGMETNLYQHEPVGLQLSENKLFRTFEGKRQKLMGEFVECDGLGKRCLSLNNGVEIFIPKDISFTHKMRWQWGDYVFVSGSVNHAKHYGLALEYLGIVGYCEGCYYPIIRLSLSKDHGLVQMSFINRESEMLYRLANEVGLFTVEN